jgi:hypothetical protein
MNRAKGNSDGIKASTIETWEISYKVIACSMK